MLRRVISKVEPRFFLTSNVRLSAADYKYTKDHFWVKEQKDGSVKVGISDYAQDKAGEFMAIGIEKLDEQITQDDEIGHLESTKCITSVYAPVSGIITEVNPAVSSRPQLANRDPLDKGWIVKMKPIDTQQLDSLLTEDSYLAFLEEELSKEEEDPPKTDS